MPENAPSAASPDNLAENIARLEKFIARRFDEISMEINATSQIVGMSEDALTARFGEVLGVLQDISQHDSGTAHNVGVELDAVISATESAANQILDSVGVIEALIASDINWADTGARVQLLAAIREQAATITGACAFQDLAGQRITRTLDNIRAAEDKLADTLQKIGLDARPANTSDTAAPANATQSDIDALFD